MAIKIMLGRTLDAKLRSAKDAGHDIGFKEAVEKVRQILQQKGKVYLEPVTMVGDYLTIMNNLFLNCQGPALNILPNKVKFDIVREVLFGKDIDDKGDKANGE